MGYETERIIDEGRLKMKKFRMITNALAITVFTFAFASLAQAQATRTWVSGVGNDADPCSRTAPCKTFAGAISKTAAGGEIDVLDPGGFGAVTITKSITIDGTYGAGFGSILASATNGVNVNDGATGSPGTIVVTLRRLSINGAGTTLGVTGVNFTSGKAVNIENCNIFNFSSTGINASFSAAQAFSPQVTVTNTRIYNITGSGKGINLTHAAAGQQVTAMIDGCTIQKTATGAFFGERTRGGVRDSIFSHNTNGLIAQAPTSNDSEVNIDNCFFTYGSVGIQAGSGSTTLRVTRSTITQNSTGINLTGGSAFSNGNNAVFGNTGGETFTGAVVPLK
jgi:hypothetical protein